MSANTLTGLIPAIQVAANKVMREQIGFLPAVYMNSAAEDAAIGQNIQYPIVPAMTSSDITAAAVPTDPDGRTLSYGTMSISKSKKIAFPWTGEEQASIANIYSDVEAQTFEQAFRRLVNEVEADLFAAAKGGASYAYGTAGNTPFGTANVLTDIAKVREYLVRNGAWGGDMHMVLSPEAGSNIRGIQSSLFKVNEAGDAELLREGTLGRLQGFQFHESGQIVQHIKGTGTGYLVDLTAGYGAGSTKIHVDTGANTIVVGDIITNTKTGRDTNKYVVNTGFAGDGDGDIEIGKPGLKIAWVNNDPVTVGANYTGNWAFNRQAIHLVARVPKLPKEGALGEHTVITDPFSGLSFLVSHYPAYHKIIWEVSLAWGVKAVNSEAIVCLLG